MIFIILKDNLACPGFVRYATVNPTRRRLRRNLFAIYHAEAQRRGARGGEELIYVELS